MLLLTAALALGAGAAHAQFFPFFNQPPRPPGNVPQGGQRDNSTFPNGNPNPINPPPQTYQGGPRGGGGAVQSQPLQPPPGVSVIDPYRPPSQPLQPGPPPDRQPRNTQPVDNTPPPADEIILPPAQKITNSGAVFSGLDKITGRIINFDVAINETVQFGALQVTPRACYTRPATELTNTDAFVQVDEVTLQGEVKPIFSGWMFAASPGLHAVEHAIYDVWLTDCKNPVVTANATPTDSTPTTQPQRGQTAPTGQRTTTQQPAQRRPAQQQPQQQPPQFR
jgi:hypothetical protein